MHDIALAVPLRDGRVLVARRAEDQHLAGLWEFPGGKVADGEIPAAAAARELGEEVGLTARRLEPLAVVVHEYPDRTLRLHAFLARDVEGTVRVEGRRPWAWVSLAELEALEMPPANGPILRALGWRLAR